MRRDVPPDQRFGDKADAYAQHRPGYPSELADWLAERGALATGSVIADVGAGTGLSTRLFLGRGWSVFAVEPNGPMREAARRGLGEVPGLRIVEGAGEALPFGDRSVDLIAIAQALHWLDLDRARAEFGRVLRPAGRVAVLYNSRDLSAPFAAAIEEVFERLAPERSSVGHLGESRDRRIAELFRGGPVEAHEVRHAQRLSWDGVRGWLASISYLPPVGSSGRAAIEEELRVAFDRFARDGAVSVDYLASVHLGTVREP